MLPRNDSRAGPPAVAYALDPPAAGSVALAGTGLFVSPFATNLEFLVNGSRGSTDDMLYPYRRRHNASAAVLAEGAKPDAAAPSSVGDGTLDEDVGGELRLTTSDKSLHNQPPIIFNAFSY